MHVLHHQVRSAEIYEAKEGVVILELQMAKHLCELEVAVVLVDDIAICLNDLETLHELLLPVLIHHVLLELRKLAPRYVYHVLVLLSHRFLRQRIRLLLLLLRVSILILIISIFVLRYRCLLREWPLRYRCWVAWSGRLTLLI